jgi:hypothetical protein
MTMTLAIMTQLGNTQGWSVALLERRSLVLIRLEMQITFALTAEEMPCSRDGWLIQAMMAAQVSCQQGLNLLVALLL